MIRSSDNGHLTRYAPRVDQESTEPTESPPVLLGSKFRRRPPNSLVERERRKAWGAKWGSLLQQAARQAKQETEAK